MKESSVLHSFLVFSLVTLLFSHALKAIDMKEIEGYFKKLKNGAECFIKNKPCTKEEKRAVFQAAGAITGTLVLLSAGIITFTQREKISRFLLFRSKEWKESLKQIEEFDKQHALTLIETSQDKQSTKNQLLVEFAAIGKPGVVQFLIEQGAQLDASNNALNIVKEKLATHKYPSQWKKDLQKVVQLLEKLPQPTHVVPEETIETAQGTKDAKQWVYTSAPLGQISTESRLIGIVDELKIAWELVDPAFAKSPNYYHDRDRVTARFFDKANYVAMLVNNLEKLSSPEQREAQDVTIKTPASQEEYYSLPDFIELILQYYKLNRNENTGAVIPAVR